MTKRTLRFIIGFSIALVISIIIFVLSIVQLIIFNPFTILFIALCNLGLLIVSLVQAGEERKVLNRKKRIKTRREMKLKFILKILNPIIFIINFISYTVHLEKHRNCHKYKHYDFSKDIRYF